MMKKLIAGVEIDCTEEEIAEFKVLNATAKTAEEVALIALRSQRDQLLAETDWWVLPDRTPSTEQLEYRQALRDITNVYTSLEDAVFPSKPQG